MVLNYLNSDKFPFLFCICFKFVSNLIQNSLFFRPFSEIWFNSLHKTFHTFQFVSDLLQKWINSCKNEAKFGDDSSYFFRNNQINIFQVFLLDHSSNNVTNFPGHSHDCPSSDGDELSEGYDEEPSNNNGYEFPNSTTLKEDHQLFDQPMSESCNKVTQKMTLCVRYNSLLWG